MRSPKIKLRQIFKESELQKFKKDIKQNTENLNVNEDQMNKDDFKSIILELCKTKLKDSYLISSLNWMESETKDDKIKKILLENENLKKTLNFIEENCKIKVNQNFNKNNNNLAKKTNKNLSLSQIKSLINKKNSSLDYQNNQIKQDQFISFSEESICKIETQDFNIFNLEKEVGPENTLSVVSCYIFTAYGLYSLIPYYKFEKFMQEITRGYIRSNPYHNDLHAADVTQTAMIYLKIGNMKEFLKLNDLDLAAFFISCACHDFRHPGYTNAFLVATNDPIAIKYNDKNVLENYHISQTFKLMISNDDVNIFSGLSKEDYKIARKRMIGNVLATDMVFHFGQFNSLKTSVSTYSIKNGKNREKIVESSEKLFDTQQQILEIVVHAADISNCTKPFDIYRYWADKVVTEFFRQGDKEKELGLPVSNGMDRCTTTLAKSQVGFMNFIVTPFFTTFCEIFNELSFLVENSKNNTAIFQKVKDEEEAKANKEKKI